LLFLVPLLIFTIISSALGICYVAGQVAWKTGGGRTTLTMLDAPLVRDFWELCHGFVLSLAWFFIAAFLGWVVWRLALPAIFSDPVWWFSGVGESNVSGELDETLRQSLTEILPTRTEALQAASWTAEQVFDALGTCDARALDVFRSG
jgi:hypothetical protein